MKKRKMGVFTAAIAIMLLAACSAGTKGTAASGEMAVPEVSSQDLLVNSLEYLLEDEEEAPVEEEQAENDTAAVTVAVYYGDGGSLMLDQETAEVEALTPESLLEVLLKHNIVSLDTQVLAFEQQDQEGATILYLDLSDAAGEYLKTMSAEAESIIVAALADTFLDNYDADGIYITVEGSPLTTSHRVYDQMITVCTPEELMDAVAAENE